MAHTFTTKIPPRNWVLLTVALASNKSGLVNSGKGLLTNAEHPYLVEISERETEITFVGVNYKDDADAARTFLV